jgi:alpha-tubulin suppressor-like RCC1 family protein
VGFRPAVKISAVSAGSFHSVALTSDGAVYCWGDNFDGELGDGTETSHGVPVKVAGLPAAVAAIAGEAYTLALDRNGNVWGWGNNSDGELADGSQDERKAPVQAKGISGVTALAAGTGHVLALNGAGEVWTWGANDAGQLGVAASDPVLAPRRVIFPATAGRMTAVAASGNHSYAVDVNGALWAWGGNDDYALGDAGTDRATPTQVSGFGKVVKIAAGPSGAAAVTADGKAWVWGFWAYDKPNQLANLTTAAKAVRVGEYLQFLGPARQRQHRQPERVRAGQA